MKGRATFAPGMAGMLFLSELNHRRSQENGS